MKNEAGVEIMKNCPCRATRTWLKKDEVSARKHKPSTKMNPMQKCINTIVFGLALYELKVKKMPRFASVRDVIKKKKSVFYNGYKRL